MPTKSTLDTYVQQPAVKAIIKLLARKRGATVAEVCDATGYVNHSVRSVLSRLRSRARMRITRITDERRGNVYHAGLLPRGK